MYVNPRWQSFHFQERLHCVKRWVAGLCPFYPCIVDSLSGRRPLSKVTKRQVFFHRVVCWPQSSLVDLLHHKISPCRWRCWSKVEKSSFILHISNSWISSLHGRKRFKSSMKYPCIFLFLDVVAQKNRNNWQLQCCRNWSNPEKAVS